MKKIIGLGIIIVVVLTIMVLYSSNPFSLKAQPAQQFQTQQNGPWATFTSTSTSIRLQYPPESQVQSRGNVVGVAYSVNATSSSSALTDGYAVVVSKTSYPANQSFATMANTIYQNAKQNAAKQNATPSPLRPTTINGKPAYTFSVAGNGPVVTSYVVDFGGGRAAVIACAVAGPNSAAYQQRVNSIISSVRI